MSKLRKKKKAKVYIWPNLSEERVHEVEEECAYAGYETKRLVRIGRVTCWEVE